MSLLSSVAYFLTGGSKRHIASIVPDVVIKEVHTDKLTITDHPVQRGSVITDHACKDPEQLEMEFGWSNSSFKLSSLLSGKSLLETTDLRTIYNQLLGWQESCIPISIGTGKREYTDMLIESLRVQTESSTENVLQVTAFFRKIRLVDTEDRMLAAENQATDRAHRIGQKRVVTVYKLVAEHTIEEKVVELQQKKKELADQVLSGEEMGSILFDREELLKLFQN